MPHETATPLEAVEKPTSSLIRACRTGCSIGGWIGKGALLVVIVLLIGTLFTVRAYPQVGARLADYLPASLSGSPGSCSAKSFEGAGGDGCCASQEVASCCSCCLECEAAGEEATLVSIEDSSDEPPAPERVAEEEPPAPLRTISAPLVD
ncbi:hypothetical protein [Lignipirellula cremea]|uniref:Uncharacterized protein n=1 Tax=Lignipirellula cremea TaxID=2528010 RepID=A0A518DMW6_9BACT|nr:hypothetical protein [Lignipirellula cremea]QDU93163.1 hypothetical protein Pla8534_09420 [Lignipirellula cremea]